MPIKMKVCNTADYNKSLMKRGRIFHLFDEAIKVWFYNDVEKREKSKFIYSDRLIQVLAAFRYVLKYPFRQLQGLLEDYMAHNNIKLPVPNFTTLCRRMARLLVTIRDHRDKGERKGGELVDIVIDSTGINIYHTGGGHSKENGKYRKYKHLNQVRKMHVALDPKSRDVVSMEMSAGEVADASMVPVLLEGIPSHLCSVYADGAYDREITRKACVERKAGQIIPPKRTSVIRKNRRCEIPDLWNERNNAIKEIRNYDNHDEGLKAWKKAHGYGKRSLVEAYFSRFKAIFGFHFMSKKEQSRRNELAIKVQILNSYNAHEKAIFEKVI